MEIADLDNLTKLKAVISCIRIFQENYQTSVNYIKVSKQTLL